MLLKCSTWDWHVQGNSGFEMCVAEVPVLGTQQDWNGKGHGRLVRYVAKVHGLGILWDWSVQGNVRLIWQNGLGMRSQSKCLTSH